MDSVQILWDVAPWQIAEVVQTLHVSPEEFMQIKDFLGRAEPIVGSTYGYGDIDHAVFVDALLGAGHFARLYRTPTYVHVCFDRQMPAERITVWDLSAARAPDAQSIYSPVWEPGSAGYGLNYRCRVCHVDTRSAWTNVYTQSAWTKLFPEAAARTRNVALDRITRKAISLCPHAHTYFESLGWNRTDPLRWGLV